MLNVKNCVLIKLANFRKLPIICLIQTILYIFHIKMNEMHTMKMWLTISIILNKNRVLQWSCKLKMENYLGEYLWPFFKLSLPCKYDNGKPFCSESLNIQSDINIWQRHISWELLFNFFTFIFCVCMCTWSRGQGMTCGFSPSSI